ncbi:MAG: nucleotidyltransferase family protein [Candidatus Omnitrophota bacterium]
MKAVILAAGYATRLYPLTLNTPKCLLEVGGRTILDWLCAKLLRLQDLEEILVVTNAKFFSQLKNWQKKTRLGCPVRVLDDGTHSNETRLGAIGDLNFAIAKAGLDSDVLMLASDNLFDAGFEGFMRFAQEKKDKVCVGLYDIKDPALAAGKFGVLEINGSGEVTAMEEKPERPKSTLIGMGVYYFPKASLAFVRDYLRDTSAKDAPGFYIRWLREKTPVFGFLFSGMWYDIGDLKSLEEARGKYVEQN